MADRYWVGGTGTWNTTNTTNWSTTSGGSGGASVPGTSDAVFFDSASGTGSDVVTVGANVFCSNLNLSGYIGTFTGSGNSITVQGGSIFIDPSTNYTFTGNLTCTGSGSGTLTTSGKSLNTLIINGVGRVIALNDALTCTGAITLTNGTFTTNNYNVTATQLASSNSNTRVINLGSSVITLSLNGTAIDFSNANGLTLNAGTSEFVLTATGPDIFCGSTGGTGKTFNNITYTNGTPTTSGGATNLRQIQGSNIFNNIAIAAPTSNGITHFEISANQIINGTLSITGSQGNRRVWFRSNTYGVRRTLTINSTPSLTDVDFRDIIVNGTAAPISGTRIGNRGACAGITFSAPKTVYWSLGGAAPAWTDDGWATSSGGTPNTDNFPLAQDKAIIDNASTPTQIILQEIAVGEVDMSTKTTSINIAINGGNVIYGSWKNGSGVSFTGTSALTFSGAGTKTITCAGRTFSCGINISAYGGTVELADALSIGSQTLTVTDGTFDTKGYNVTGGTLSSSNNNPRKIILGSSTINLSGLPAISMTTTDNLVFDAGTSTVIQNGAPSNQNFNSTGLTWYNVSFTSTSQIGWVITGSNTFNNLTIISPTTGISSLSFGGNCTINGTLTVAGAAPNRRVLVSSSVIGISRTLTVNTLSANNCDFRDITIAGAAAGSSPSLAGNCGNNSGVNFPAPKTVYWNLSGTQNWRATAWASSSGGTPDANNFPLAQDTAIFDNTGSAGTVLIDSPWNIGTIDMSNRTTAMTLTPNASHNIHGDWKFGTGITVTSSSNVTQFRGRTTQTITSNGISFNNPILIDNNNGVVQLADALTIDPATARNLTLTSGTFNAVTYNVSIGRFAATSSGGSPAGKILFMGTGLWTLSGAGDTWTIFSDTILYKGAADILLSNTGTGARQFLSNNYSYNKLTIGGTTGTSTLTFNSNASFSELASTKTVAHTIRFQGSSTTTIGKWSVTGSAGNVVTITSDSTQTYQLIINGSSPTGIDYLNVNYCVIPGSSPSEFFVGANSSNTTSNSGSIFFTAVPAPRTLYWVGGTGNWSSTTKWSLSSGGSSGEAIPRSFDDVIFDSLSNATAYTATIDAASRCNQLTISGPASGNVTLAGSAQLSIHGNTTLPSTGLTRTYSGRIVLSSSTTGKTFTTNGVGLNGIIEVNGVGCEWTLGSSLTNGQGFTLTAGNFNTANYALSVNQISSNSGTDYKGLSLGSSIVTSTGGVDFGTTLIQSYVFNFNAGTSSISCGNSVISFFGNNKTFYDVTLGNPSFDGGISILGSNTFNTLTFTAVNQSIARRATFSDNQIINTLTISAGSNATNRNFLQSNLIGTARTLTCNTVSALTDVDFRDIFIAGDAVSGGNITGTRLGDCGGNSNITFDSGKTVYWNLSGTQNWHSTAWATSSGGTPNINNFPLAQDTAIINNSSAGSQINISAYNIGTIDCSSRTNALTISVAASQNIYGSYLLGTGITLSGTFAQTFAGRTTQTFTSNGRQITFPITVNNVSGTFQLGDAFNSISSIELTSGTFNSSTYSLGASTFSSTNSNQRTINMGSGLWSLFGTGTVWNISNPANLTFNKGTANISLTSTSTSARTFSGGGLSYNKLTIGDSTGTSTTTINQNNTFTELASTKTVSHTIALGTSTLRVGKWTISGSSGNVVNITGETSSLIFTGVGTTDPVDYLNIQGRAYGPNYEVNEVWYAGANSTNSGSLGWEFTAAPAAEASNANFFLLFA